MNFNRPANAPRARVFARTLGVVAIVFIMELGLGFNAAQAQQGPRMSREERVQVQQERRMMREERRAERAPPAARPLSQEERQQLRRDIRNHGRDVYGGSRQ